VPRRVLSEVRHRRWEVLFPPPWLLCPAPLWFCCPGILFPPASLSPPALALFRLMELQLLRRAHVETLSRAVSVMLSQRETLVPPVTL